MKQAGMTVSDVRLSEGPKQFRICWRENLLLGDLELYGSKNGENLV